MGWTVELDPKALQDLDAIDRRETRRILRFLHERLALRDNPREVGEALQGSRFSGMWKYRVGNYRLVCEIQDAEVTILVLRVGHRREIYR